MAPRSGRMLTVLNDPARPESSVFDRTVAEARYASGFYALEHDEFERFRWMGLRGRIELDPKPGPGFAELRVWSGFYDLRQRLAARLVDRLGAGAGRMRRDGAAGRPAVAAVGEAQGTTGSSRFTGRWRIHCPNLHYSRRSRISHRRGLLDRERSLSDMAAGAAGGVAWPSRHRAVAEARLGEGSAGTGGGARDRDVRRASRGL